MRERVADIIAEAFKEIDYSLLSDDECPLCNFKSEMKDGLADKILSLIHSELEAVKHHTIEEEMWRINDALRITDGK